MLLQAVLFSPNCALQLIDIEELILMSRGSRELHQFLNSIDSLNFLTVQYKLQNKNSFCDFVKAYDKKYLTDRTPKYVHHELCAERSAVVGNLKVFKKAYDRVLETGDDDGLDNWMVSAITNGHYDILDYVLSKNNELQLEIDVSKIVEVLCEVGNYDKAKSLITDTSTVLSLIIGAIAAGNMETIKKIKEDFVWVITPAWICCCIRESVWHNTIDKIDWSIILNGQSRIRVDFKRNIRKDTSIETYECLVKMIQDEILIYPNFAISEFKAAIMNGNRTIFQYILSKHNNEILSKFSRVTADKLLGLALQGENVDIIDWVLSYKLNYSSVGIIDLKLLSEKVTKSIDTKIWKIKIAQKLVDTGLFELWLKARCELTLQGREYWVPTIEYSNEKMLRFIIDYIANNETTYNDLPFCCLLWSYSFDVDLVKTIWERYRDRISYHSAEIEYFPYFETRDYYISTILPCLKKLKKK